MLAKVKFLLFSFVVVLLFSGIDETDGVSPLMQLKDR